MIFMDLSKGNNYQLITLENCGAHTSIGHVTYSIAIPK